MPECLVCFTTDWVANTPCNHYICIECIFKLKKDECPMCRRLLMYSISPEIRTYLQLYRNQQKSNNQQPAVDVNDIEEFPPL